MKKNFIKFNKIIFTALSLMLIVLCLVGCEGQDMESLLQHEALQNEKYADMVKQIQGGNKTQVEEDIIGGKSNNKDKVDVNDNGLDLVKKDRVDSNGKVWTEIQGEKEKEYTDEYSLNKQEKALLEQKKQNALQGELLAFRNEIDGMDADDMYKKYGTGNAMDDKWQGLASAGLYAFYDIRDRQVKVMSEEEIRKIIQERVDANEDNMGLNTETTKIYEELKNRKLENQIKVEQKNINSLIVHLTYPKSADQIGGNKIGENDNSYKGQYRESRKYGNEVYSGSMLVACNTLLGTNYERYYECRNGFIVLNREGYRIYNALSGGKRTEFDKVEMAVFKLNNPNVKITDDFRVQEYGTFTSGGEPTWHDSFGNSFVNYLGKNMYMSGNIVNGKIVTSGWASNYSYPGSWDGTKYNDEYGEEMARAFTVAEQNAVLQKYLY